MFIQEAITKTMKKLTILLFLLASVVQAQTNISKIEYFFDRDPGFDSAITFTGFAHASDVQFQIAIPENLPLGIHTIGMRSKDSSGIWSHTNFFSINIADTSNGSITTLEYFWDADPGFGYGMDTIINSPIQDITNGILYAYVPNTIVSQGIHFLFVRSQDSRGRWSHTNYDSILVTITDVKDLENQIGVQAFPNPFTEQLTIKPTDNSKVRIIIYDPQGKLVIDRMIQEETQLNLKECKSGMYTAFFWKEKDRIYTMKLVKQ
jgi:hypothetical protein